MIEKKLDFDSYIKFVKGGERSALVYIHNFSCLKHLIRDFDITHKFPFINAVAVSGDFACIRRLSTSPYVEYITAQSKVFALGKDAFDGRQSDKKNAGGIGKIGGVSGMLCTGGGMRGTGVNGVLGTGVSGMRGTSVGSMLGAGVGGVRGASVGGSGGDAKKIFLKSSSVGKNPVANFALQTELTGRGVTMAVMDTGINPHIDLSVPFFRIKAFKDVYEKSDMPYDDNGHGTFVAGVAAGNGLLSAGRILGVAPEADLVGVKVIAKSGECGAFAVLDGMQWVLDNAARLKIKVVCMSFGSTPLSTGDPLKLGAEALARAGITVVCAAGNSGENGLKSPAISGDVIAVGAVNINDMTEAPFSSRGTFAGLKKPEVYASGINVEGLHFDGAYTTMSGTSAAAPFVAGAACLLHEKYKGLSPADVKQMLIKSAEEYDGRRILEFEKKSYKPPYFKP